MPGRHGAGKLGGSSGAKPCGDPNRSPLDVAGRVNDLINCYLIYAGQELKLYLPLVIIAVILVAVMLFAAREILKD